MVNLSETTPSEICFSPSRRSYQVSKAHQLVVQDHELLHTPCFSVNWLDLVLVLIQTTIAGVNM